MITNNDDTNVANNVVQPKVQDLTEQWIYGKLKNGFYYIKDINDRVTTILYKQDHISIIKKVLAPVPSYVEWNQLKKFLEEFNALDVAKENQQLKFLLKECRYKIIADLDNARLCESSVDIEDFEYLLNRIDNAIGEEN